MKTTYCIFCGARAGRSHETWCPLNTDITWKAQAHA
jgi:hypothetical protein